MYCTVLYLYMYSNSCRSSGYSDTQDRISDSSSPACRDQADAKPEAPVRGRLAVARTGGQPAMDAIGPDYMALPPTKCCLAQGAGDVTTEAVGLMHCHFFVTDHVQLFMDHTCSCTCPSRIRVK